MIENSILPLELSVAYRLKKFMSKNHMLLKELQVSSLQLDKLVEIAITAGAHGAKLAGAGIGGNIIALVDDTKKDDVINALEKLSEQVIFTIVK